MTLGEKVARHEEVGRCCVICRMACAAFGPTVIWDHRVPLAIGGSNDLDNMDPHHAGPCAKVKTALDMKAIAKAKRLAGETKAGPTKNPIRSRGFDRTKSRGFDGRVRERT
jgi:hypothetical protein